MTALEAALIFLVLATAGATLAFCRMHYSRMKNESVIIGDYDEA
jgi:hypothetical protein